MVKFDCACAGESVCPDLETDFCWEERERRNSVRGGNTWEGLGMFGSGGANGCEMRFGMVPLVSRATLVSGASCKMV